MRGLLDGDQCDHTIPTPPEGASPSALGMAGQSRGRLREGALCRRTRRGLALVSSVLGTSTARVPARFSHSLTHSPNPGCATRHLVPPPPPRQVLCSCGKEQPRMHPHPQILAVPSRRCTPSTENPLQPPALRASSVAAHALQSPPCLSAPLRGCSMKDRAVAP